VAWWISYFTLTDDLNLNYPAFKGHHKTHAVVPFRAAGAMVLPARAHMLPQPGEPSACRTTRR
jgi:hypothetical protein